MSTINYGKYTIEQEACRSFTLTVRDEESGSVTAVLFFSSCYGSDWKYRSKLPISSWNKRDFAETLNDRDNELVLWVPEYQDFLVKQLKTEDDIVVKGTGYGVDVHSQSC